MMRGNQYQDRFDQHNDGAFSSFEISRASFQQARSRLIEDAMSPGFFSSSSSRKDMSSHNDRMPPNYRAPEIQPRYAPGMPPNISPDMPRQNFAPSQQLEMRQGSLSGAEYPWYIPDAPYQTRQRSDARADRNARADEFERGSYPPGEPAWKRYWRAAQSNPQHEIRWGDLPSPYEQQQSEPRQHHPRYNPRNNNNYSYDRQFGEREFGPQAFDYEQRDSRYDRYTPHPRPRQHDPREFDPRQQFDPRHRPNWRDRQDEGLVWNDPRFDRGPGRYDRYYDDRDRGNRIEWGDQDGRRRDKYDRHGRRNRHKHDSYDRNDRQDLVDGRDRYDRDRYLDLPERPPIPRPRRDFADNDRQRDYRLRDERWNRQDRDFSPNDGGQPSERQELIARAARRVASEMGSVGWCARGVQRALARAGLPEFVGSGNAWNMLNPMMRSGKFEVVPAHQVREGDIALRQRPGDYGHIAVMLGKDRNGRQLEASDHITVHRQNNPRYSRTVYLRHVG